MLECYCSIVRNVDIQNVAVKKVHSGGLRGWIDLNLIESGGNNAGYTHYSFDGSSHLQNVTPKVGVSNKEGIISLFGLFLN